MSKPRIFVSSTYYDLKHVRSSLDIFIESLGFEPILSEKGDIAYTPDAPLDVSCYREAANADIFVLIIGGRYGAESSGSQKKLNRTFFEKYESITKKEYESAQTRNIPIYILVESNVYSEYQTYLRNKGKEDITYAHVDSVNVFYFIEEILSESHNNQMHPFERFSDIETWLREQWAGFFQELLRCQSRDQQLTELSAQISVLTKINGTLQNYLEAMMPKVITKEGSASLIKSEKERLQELELYEQIKNDVFCRFVMRNSKVSFDEFLNAIKEASFSDFAKHFKLENQFIRNTIQKSETARRDFNKVRKLLDLKPLHFSSDDQENLKGMDNDEST